MSQRKRPNSLNRVQIFLLLKMGLQGYQKIRNFMEISKNKTYLSDKMHLKEDIYKKLNFSPKKWQSPKIMRFLSITLFRRIFHKSTYDFRNPRKITDFLIPMKVYFEQNFFLTLLRGFCHFFEDKNRHYYANS